METNSSKIPEVLFADHETGVCYPYPENGEQNEKPYISYEYLAGIISSRNEYIEKKLKELGTEKGDEKKNEKKLILQKNSLKFRKMQYFILWQQEECQILSPK